MRSIVKSLPRVARPHFALRYFASTRFPLNALNKDINNANANANDNATVNASNGDSRRGKVERLFEGDAELYRPIVKDGQFFHPWVRLISLLL